MPDQLLPNQLIQVQNRLPGVKMYHSRQGVVKFVVFLGRQARVEHFQDREALLDDDGYGVRGVLAEVISSRGKD